MKAMWLGFAAAIVIAIVAGVVLNGLDTSSAEVHASKSTRL